MKCYKICRVKCNSCGDVLEHINQTKEDNALQMIYCSCGQVALDPSAQLYRIVGNSEDFEDLSEEWKE